MTPERIAAIRKHAQLYSNVDSESVLKLIEFLDDRAEVLARAENATLRDALEPTPCEHCSNLAYDDTQGPGSFPACHDCYRKVQVENARLRAEITTAIHCIEVERYRHAMKVLAAALAGEET